MKAPVFKEGFNVLSTRFVDVAESTDHSITVGLLARVIDGFTEGVFALGRAPFLGYGLGIGTNAGAKFLTGRSIFLLAESEWTRIFLESGPVLGLAYVIWRCAAAFRIGVLCVRSVRLDNLLPLLLFSACFMQLLSGQFGQPTILGFAVFTTGLALAARTKEEDSIPGKGDEVGAEMPRHVLARRSPYAERLHDAATSPDRSNGFIDR